MFKIIKTIFSIFLLLILVVYYFKIPLSSLPRDLVQKISPELFKFERNSLIPAIEKFEKQIFSPPPLRVALPKQATQAPENAAKILSRAGIISETNIRRGESGLPSLSSNTILDRGAEAKLHDLFAKQYFEHVSPSGVGPADIAKSAGYDYVVIGENLALGNFSSDKTLLDAWMASPGHRANILNSRYKEIGVAVGEGFYQGETVWIAVQEFGLPLSSCPSPSSELFSLIDKSESALTAVQNELDQRRVEVSSLPRSNPSYNQKVDEYNALSIQYNTLIEATKKIIADYNRQVEVTNSCRSGK